MEYTTKWVLGGITLILGLIALFTLLSSIAIIPAGYRGVLLTWGAPREQSLSEGLHFITPIAQTVKLIDVRIKRIDARVDAGTWDLQSVDTIIALNYHVLPGRAVEVYRTVSGDVEKTIIEPALEEAVKATTSQFSAEELIQKRAEVKRITMDLLTDRLAENGLLVDEFSIVNLDFSPEFNAAIEAKQLAVQDALKSQRELEKVKIEAEKRVVDAEAEARKKVVAAEASATEKLLNAGAQANATRMRAEADATAIYLTAEATAEGLRMKREQLSDSIINMRLVEGWDGVIPVQYNFGGDEQNLWLKLPGLE